MASKDFGDLDLHFRIFYAIHHLRASRLIIISAGPRENAQAESFSRRFGTAMGYRSYQELKSLYDGVEAPRAEQAALAYRRSALRVVEPSPEDIRDALRMHLAIQETPPGRGQCDHDGLLGRVAARAIAGPALRILVSAQRRRPLRGLPGRFAVRHDATSANALHFVQNPAFNANKSFSNLAGLPRAVLRMNRYGANGDGPIYLPTLYDGRNRTFWMYGWEGYRIANPRGTLTTTVPTAAQKNGDFSALLRIGPQYQIYDPYTIAPAAGGRYSRQPLPGNIIPASRIEPGHPVRAGGADHGTFQSFRPRF